MRDDTHTRLCTQVLRGGCVCERETRGRLRMRAVARARFSTQVLEVWVCEKETYRENARRETHFRLSMQISEVCIRVKERLIERMREERLTSDFLRRFLRCVCGKKRFTERMRERDSLPTFYADF